MSKANIPVSTPIVRKEYAYAVGGTRLTFTLRQDDSQEMVQFRRLLDMAIVDVDKDLATLRSNRKKK